MLELLQWALIVLSATTVVWLVIEIVSGVRGKPRLFRLKPLRGRGPGTADLLNFAALVDDGIVLTKGGELLAGFWYRGRDLDSSTEDERNLVTGRVNAALLRLGSGWVSWIDAVRLPSQGYPEPWRSHFPDPITEMIDQERRTSFQREGAHYESEYALVLMYSPPPVQQTRLLNWLWDNDGEVEQEEQDQLARAIELMRQQLREMEDMLSDVLRLRRMATRPVRLGSGPVARTVLRDDLVTYLHFCVTGHLQPINIPHTPMYLDTYIGGEPFTPGELPKIGEKFIGVVAIEGFGGETWPNMLDALDRLAIPYRWSSRMIYMDQREAQQHLARFRRTWKQKEKGFLSQIFKTGGGQVNEDAVRMRRTAEAAKTDADSGVVTYGYYTPVVVLFADDEAVLQERCRDVRRVIQRQGLTARLEDINSVEAWLGSVPGHPQPNVRRPLIHTLNLADLLPLASAWAGHATHPCDKYPPNSPPLLQAATSGTTPFRLNTHVDDVGHTLIFGPTGSGKSVLLAMLVAQARRYRDIQINVFDHGRSMLPLTLATGGRHYALAAEGNQMSLCPLEFLDTDADCAWAEGWIASCFELQAEKQPTPRQKEAIGDAIRLMRQTPVGRSLSDFVTTCQDNEVREAIKPYTGAGQLRYLLDGQQDELGMAALNHYEISDLMEMGDVNAIPVLLYLFRRFERSLTGLPAFLVIDEAWIVLGHPVFRAKVREWLKTLRRANCAVILATQSLSDAVRSGIFDVLLESCPTKILLPNEDADKAGTAENPGPKDMYRMMGLNEREIAIIQQAQKKRHYYYTSVEGRRLFDLDLGPIALSFVAVSSKEQLTQIGEFVARHGDAWPFEWLKHREVKYEAVLEKAA